MCRGRRDLLATFRQARHDLEKVRARMTEDELAAWRSRLDAGEARAVSELMLLAGDSFAVRREGYTRMGSARLFSVWQFFKCAYLLPQPLGDCLLFAYAVARYVMRRMKGVLGR